MADYEVYAGNLGCVHRGSSKAAALKSFASEVRDSKAGYGRVAGEAVTLMADGEPIKEYFPPLFAKGERVQLHPATDRWMMGDRYGEVVGHTKDKIRVKLDRSGKTISISARNLTDLEGNSRGDED